MGVGCAWSLVSDSEPKRKKHKKEKKSKKEKKVRSLEYVGERCDIYRKPANPRPASRGSVLRAMCASAVCTCSLLSTASHVSVFPSNALRNPNPFTYP